MVKNNVENLVLLGTHNQFNFTWKIGVESSKINTHFTLSNFPKS